MKIKSKMKDYFNANDGNPFKCCICNADLNQDNCRRIRHDGYEFTACISCISKMSLPTTKDDTFVTSSFTIREMLQSFAYTSNTIKSHINEYHNTNQTQGFLDESREKLKKLETENNDLKDKVSHLENNITELYKKLEDFLKEENSEFKIDRKNSLKKLIKSRKKT